MYDEPKKLLEYHLKKLNNEYARANTISKKKKIASQLKTFENMCFYNLFDMIDILKLEWLEDIQIHNLENYQPEKFISILQENNDFYSRLSNRVINIYSKLEYPFYKDYYKTGKISHCKNLPQKELDEIILEFIKEYDKELVENVVNKNVFLQEADNWLGKVNFFPALEDTYMFLSNTWEKSIVFNTSAVHEYGHIFEINLDFKTKNFNYQKSYRYSPFGEVSSIFFEYAFLMYLKKQKLYEEVVDSFLNYCYFIPLFEDFATINILTKIDNNEENIIITDNVVIDEINKIKEKANYYDFLKEKSVINYRKTYLYGIGKLMAIYLYDNYEQDPEKFKKEFKNSLLTYPLTNNISAFNNVGASEEELLSCKKLKRTLESFINKR